MGMLWVVGPKVVVDSFIWVGNLGFKNASGVKGIRGLGSHSRGARSAEAVYTYACIIADLGVVFGEVLQGSDLVNKIDGKGSSSGKPSAQIVITRSGVTE